MNFLGWTKSLYLLILRDNSGRSPRCTDILLITDILKTDELKNSFIIKFHFKKTLLRTAEHKCF